MKTRTIILIMLVFILSASVLSASGTWKRLPLGGSSWDNISWVNDIAVEKNGNLWIVGNLEILYWDGTGFTKPKTNLPRGGFFVGGKDRDLFVYNIVDGKKQGKIYKLSDNEATYTTDIYYDRSIGKPGLYVTRQNLLVNWASMFLGVYSKNEWTRIETPLNAEYARLFETKDGLFVYYNQNLVSVDKNGEISSKEINLPISSIPGQRRIHAALWRDKTAVLLDYGYKPICYINLLGKSQSFITNAVNLDFENGYPYDILGTPDGSVWIYANDGINYKYHFYRLKPDGTVSKLTELDSMAWDNTRIWQYPGTVLARKDGSVWFGRSDGRITVWKSGKVMTMDVETEPGEHVLRLLESSKGKIYAASAQAVYEYIP